MAVKHLYATVTGVTNIKEIQLRDNIASAATSIEVTATSHTLSIGSAVDVDMGFVGDYTTVLTGGIVKRIQQRKPEFDYVITIYDKLVMAQDNFLASDDPDVPISYISTAPETIVQDMLTNSGVTGNYYGTATGFLSGLPANPYKINLTSAWQVIEGFNRICAYMTWCTPNGDVYFNPRKPYIVGGDTASLSLTTGNTGNILDIEYVKSDDQLRNKVVVYGKPGIKSSGSASSPYVPAGTYKTLVLSNDFVDRQDMADATVALNLTMFNRLTENLNVTIVGKASCRCRDVVSVYESFTGMAGDLWFVSATDHSWSKSGYTTKLSLVR